MVLIAWLSVLSVAVPGVAAAWLALTGRRRAALIAAAAAALMLVGGVALGGQDLALQQVVSTLIMPVGLWWTASLFVALWGLARAPRALGLTMVGLWLAFTVLANGWLATALMTRLEATIPERPLPAEGLDVIAVPGGGASFAADGVTPQVGDFGDRVVLAARLYRAGRTRKLLTTGSTIEGLSAALDLTLASRTLWRELGVPDADMIGIAEPKNTSQEIVAIKALAEREGWTRVGMLGSGFHLPRILALCDRAGLEVYPIVADRRGNTLSWHPLYAVPSANALRTTTLVTWELIGRAVGR